jgi:hypothetical protein
VLDAVADGVAAWSRIRDHGRKHFEDWITVDRALAIGRTEALKIARTNKAVGPRYNAAMGAWLKQHGLAEITAQERYRLLLILENLPAISAWRDVSTRRSAAGRTIRALSITPGNERPLPGHRYQRASSSAGRGPGEPDHARSIGRKVPCSRRRIPSA